MECPYCKKELPKGSIPAGRDSICWYPEDVPTGWLSQSEEGVVMLAKAGLFNIGAEAESYYCKDCNMIFTPVPEREESTMDKLKKKWDDISERREAAAEVRQARAEEEKREKERKKRAKKDPWER